MGQVKGKGEGPLFKGRAKKGAKGMSKLKNTLTDIAALLMIGLLSGGFFYILALKLIGDI
jgi:hypothetical protein